jgi:hypothetical protein
LASVRNATAFGCTVVSTITFVKSEGSVALVRVAAFKLSWMSVLAPADGRGEARCAPNRSSRNRQSIRATAVTPAPIGDA